MSEGEGVGPDPSAALNTDPRQELRELASALRHDLRRAQRRGQRRAIVGPGPALAATGALPPEPQLPVHTLQPAPSRARPSYPRATPAEEATRPVPPPGAARRPSPEIAALRARAAACADLTGLGAAVAACTACELASTRTQTVFGDGSGRRRVMFVGEAPGADEDAQGLPFVGRAGKLLDDIITKGMGLAREDVYIANVLKCRPPGNRDPQPGEKALCAGWLERQIELVDPRVLIPLGAHAACYLLGVEATIGRLRGRVHTRGGRKIVPTYHPAYLLRSPGQKKECWRDIQVAMAELGLPRPASGAGGDPGGAERE